MVVLNPPLTFLSVADSRSLGSLQYFRYRFCITCFCPEAQITVAMTRLDIIWEQLFPAEQTRIVKLLIEKVIVSPTNIELRLRANGIEQVVMELQPAKVDVDEEVAA